MFLRFIYLFLISLISLTISAQHNIKIDKVADGFTIPVDIAHAGDDRIFVVGKRGVIHVLDRNNPSMTSVFLDITSKVSSSSNEKGLLGIAFHPDYKNNGFFFLNYSDKSSNSVVARYSVANDPNTADPGSEKLIMTIPQPYGNHNGGCVKFGPDGYLYIGWGDGGSANDPGNRSQNGQELLGKMLRIDIDTDQGYVIPPTNPFLDSSAVKDEIWAIGLRNPWRYSFDRATGDLWIGDVGQNTWEEVDFQPANSEGGENYGWKCYEAEQEFNTSGCKNSGNYTFPVHFYRNQRGGEGCSITGGYVYRGNNIPSLYGHYVYADFCSGKIWALKKDMNGDFVNVEIYQIGGNQLSSFGEDIDGELYFTSVQAGAIYKINSNCDIDISLDLTHESCINSQDGTAKIIFRTTKPDSLIITWSNGSDMETVDNLGPGRHWVTIKSTECETVDSFDIIPFDLPSPCLDNDTSTITLCDIDSFLLISCEAPDGFVYHWYKDDIQLLPGSDSLRTYAVTESGSYRVKWESNDCDLGFSSIINIDLLDRPEMPSLVINSDTLWAPAGLMIYEWYLNDTVLIQTSENYLAIKESGTYTVKVGDTLSCMSELSTPLDVIKTSINDIEKNKTIVIKPNPSVDKVTVSIMQDVNDAKISIFDVNGKLVYNKTKKKMNSFTLDVVNWNSGIYFVEIKSEGTVYGGKLIVR